MLLVLAQPGRASESARGARAPAAASASASDGIQCSHGAPTNISPHAGNGHTYIDVNRPRLQDLGIRFQNYQISFFGMHLLASH